MSKAWASVLLASAALVAPMRVRARAETGQMPTIAEKTAGAQKLPGYFNLYWDAKQGKLWLEIDKWSSEFLYQSGLPAGIGSNDIGLDRGQLGRTRIVRFERSGPKVLLIQENLEYRAVSNDPDERRAVHDSFAESALWGFKVEAEEQDHALVDATDFFLRDAHGIPAALRRTKQGTYHLDSSRCAIYLPQTSRGGGFATWRLLPNQSPCGNITRSCSFRQPGTSRARTIRGPAFLALATWITRRRSASRS